MLRNSFLHTAAEWNLQQPYLADYGAVYFGDVACQLSSLEGEYLHGLPPNCRTLAKAQTTTAIWNSLIQQLQQAETSPWTNLVVIHAASGGPRVWFPDQEICKSSRNISVNKVDFQLTLLMIQFPVPYSTKMHQGCVHHCVQLAAFCLGWSARYRPARHHHWVYSYKCLTFFVHINIDGRTMHSHTCLIFWCVHEPYGTQAKQHCIEAGCNTWS